MSVSPTRLAAAALALLAFACDADEAATVTPTPDAGVGTPPAPDAGPTSDPTDAVFDPDRVLAISIELPPAEWDELRRQTRNILDVIGSSCLEEPPPRPFTYFSATVTIDGETFTNVGVRKKGFFGSLDETKPSLKVKLDEYVDGQEWSGMQRLTLNNAISDPSYVKQCLGYQLFAAAGVPSPRCNFATVEVNGVDLGLYVHVESIKKDFLRRHFADEDGNLYEGALSDFRPGWVETFQRKTNEQDPDRSDVEALVAAVEVDDAALLATLEQHFDLDAFMSFWAMELLLSHPDGYARNTNNFYLYNDPSTGLWSFIPWGIDSILQDIEMLQWEDQPAPVSVWAEGALARRLYRLPETRDRYRARLRQLLDDVWIEDDLQAELDRMAALIRPHLTADERTQIDGYIDRVRDFIASRRAVLDAELAATAPQWDRPLREPWCIDVIGTVDATFETTWGTLGTDDPFGTGTATLSYDLPGIAAPIATGATSGADADSGKAALQIIAWLADDTALLVHTVTDPAQFATGVSLPIDWTTTSGYVVRFVFPPGGGDPEMVVVGMVGDGTLELEAAGTTAGDRVAGTISAIVFEPLF